MKRVIFEIWKLSPILRTSIMGFIVLSIIAIIHSLVRILDWGQFIISQLNFASLVAMVNLYVYQIGLKKQSKRDTVDTRYRNNTNARLEEITQEFKLQREKLEIYDERLRLVETKSQQAIDFVTKEIIGREAREMKADKKELEKLKAELQKTKDHLDKIIIQQKDENN